MNPTMSLRWSWIAIASLFCLLTSALILSNGLELSSIFLALRVSSLTTALPFLLLFAAQPLQRFGNTFSLGQWTQHHGRELWIIAAVSHFIHLGQIGLYYTLGKYCSLFSWTFTIPMWGILLVFSVLAIAKPNLFFQAQVARFYSLGSWYVWFIFTAAFSLGSAAQHLLFYNLPAATLFIAAGVLRGLPRQLKTAK